MRIDSAYDVVALAGVYLIVAALLLLGCAGLWVVS